MYKEECVMTRKGKLDLKLLTAVLCGTITLSGSGFVFAGETEAEKAAFPNGNFSDEMKIEDNEDLDPEAGADSVEREGDHPDSPYFTSLDYYNMKSTDTLTILPHFKTIQQSSEWSCGVASALMVLDYYGKRGNLGEEDLAKFRSNGAEPGATSLKQEMEMVDGAGMLDSGGGFNLESSYDYKTADELHEAFPIERFAEELKAGHPILVCWIEWGGHWQVVIGYDTMGTDTTQDDVLIMADPYDTTDHNQDGYMIYGAERFYYNWSMYDFFADSEDSSERDFLFLIPTLAK